MIRSWTIKTRGAGGPMIAEYNCPEHGRHDETVMRDELGDPPEVEMCTVPITDDLECGLLSDFCISAPRVKHQAFVSAHRGKSDEAPGPWAMDTEPLADGMPYHEWKAQREKVWNDVDFADWKSEVG